jgi:small multidrug resistance pump
MMQYLYLALAIVAEVIETTCLKASDGFSKMVPSVVALFA